MRKNDRLYEQVRQLQRELQQQTVRAKKLALQAAKERRQRRALEADLRKVTTSGPTGTPDKLGENTYRSMIRRLRNVVEKQLPQNATVLVVSKGDPALVKLGKRRFASHFPQDASANYAGFYPADSIDAIEQIERLRRKGVEYLVFPATSRWWLEHYKLDQYLGQRYRLIHRDETTCVIFGFCESSPWLPLTKLTARFKAKYGRNPAILDWQTDTGLASVFTECSVFAPADPEQNTLPYLDRTIDVVILKEGDKRMREARRVASDAVLSIEDKDPLKIRIERISARSQDGPLRERDKQPDGMRTSSRSGKRILFCSYYLPQPDLDSVSRRLFHFVEFLTEDGWDVTCVAKSTARYDQCVAVLNGLGARVHPGFEETIEQLVKTEQYDVALVVFWHIAGPVLKILQRCAPSTATIVDSGDIHFLRNARRILRDSAGSRSSESLDSCFAVDMVGELNVYSAADAVFAVSQKETEWLRDFSNDTMRSFCVPDSEHIQPSTIPFHNRRGVFFIGNFEHFPNVEAADFFCNEILPQFDAKLLVEHPVYIAGNAMPDKVRGWAESLPFVRLLGWVPSVTPYLEQARLSVVPLLHGAGTKRKMIQALSTGTPTVTTSIGIEGFNVRDGEEVLIADDPVTFANAMARLLRNEELWNRLSRQGIGFMREWHSRAAAQSRLIAAITSVLEKKRSGTLRVRRPGSAEAKHAAYRDIVVRTRETAADVIPAGSRGLVVSKGDGGLLNIAGRSMSHFPQGPDGHYAGHYPVNSAEAIRHLEDLRDQGAEFLILPQTAFWWLEHYVEFRQHLESNYREVSGNKGPCMIFALLPETTSVTLESMPGKVQHPRAVVEQRPPIVEFAPNSSIILRRPVSLQLNGFNSGAAKSDQVRVLVVGVYLTNKTNNIEDIARMLAQSVTCHVVQRWAALGGGAAPGRVAEVTALRYFDKKPKFEILNTLLREENLLKFDYVITCDDDIILPNGFLDTFITLQKASGFEIAQPALTPNSFINHPIVEQQEGVFARETRFVEIGPIVSFHRSVLPLVFPFDLTSPMGWGYEHLWSSRLAKAGMHMGIIDAVPVDHSMRPSVSNYSWHEANRQRDQFFAKHRELKVDGQDLYRLLGVVGPHSSGRRLQFSSHRNGKAAGTPHLSVIIPTHNRATLLDASLESLADQTLRPSDFEVIVINDGSSDGTPEICRKWSSRLRLTHLPMQQSGIAAAKNLGVFAAAGPIVLFFDDDDIADENLLAEHLETHARYPLVNIAVLGYTEWAPALRITEIMRYVTKVGHDLFSYTTLKDGQRLDFSYFWGGRSSCKKALLTRDGVFRQEFQFGSEDIELAFRLSKLLVERQKLHRKFNVHQDDDELRYLMATVGLAVIFNRQAIQYMNRPVTYDEFCRRCERQGRSQLQFSRLYSDGVIQQWCQTPNALDRWEQVRDLLPGKVARVREVESLLSRAANGVSRQVLIQELHALYRWSFDAFKTKGIVEAMTGNESHSMNARFHAVGH